MKSLADVVAAAGLAQYAEIALLLFFGVFIAITLRVVSANKASLDRAAHLPLEDDTHVDR
jgi:cbb3-type cytochrome oxidase subunit 3